MPRLSASNASNPANEALYKSAGEFVTEGSKQSNLEKYRDKFKEGPLHDVNPNDNEGTINLDPTNPLLVREEKEAQKDYFRRLKFKYLEQEAKKNFLSSITGDAPQRVMPGENDKLEESNKQKKAALKHAKDDVEAMRQEILTLAKQNSQDHAENARDIAEVIAIQKQIRDMELELARIKASYPPENRMTTDQAEQRLDDQIVELERLTEAKVEADSRANSLRDEVARKTKEVLRLARDREREEARAADVRRGREAGGTRVHDLCRWYAASLATYKVLLGIRDARAVSQSELVLEYDLPPAPDGTKSVASLTVLFDPSGRLCYAKLAGSEIDITDAVSAACDANDTAGLIADVLVRLRPLSA